MRPSIFSTLLSASLHIVGGLALPALIQQNGRQVSLAVYSDLEELARIVDISYCVGTTGIWKPFECASRCSDFKGFELVTDWNTGIFLSDSCGYIALSHAPFKKRVIVAFRGTYSLANTIADLSTTHAEYVPFPDANDKTAFCGKDGEPALREPLAPQLLKQNAERSLVEECTNCTVHSGFMSSWRNTRCTIIPHVEKLLKEYPDYELTLVGHSLGGAVAALAALEFQARGWTPHVTTFGEPRLGNKALSEFIDNRFNLFATGPEDALYRRVTHVDDPVPLLPPEEWGYKMHAGEIYISAASVPPSRDDVQYCHGDQDPRCIAGADTTSDSWNDDAEHEQRPHGWIPAKYHFWQLMFAHRDYFWRLGVCLPFDDPWKWWSGPGLNETTDEL